MQAVVVPLEIGQLRECLARAEVAAVGPQLVVGPEVVADVAELLAYHVAAREKALVRDQGLVGLALQFYHAQPLGRARGLVARPRQGTGLHLGGAEQLVSRPQRFIW